MIILKYKESNKNKIYVAFSKSVTDEQTLFPVHVAVEVGI